MFKEALELNGFRVSGFTSSVETLSHITKNSDDFDLIISDYRMPDINGNAFHNFDYNPKFKFIGKPIPISKLLVIVKEMLDQTKTLV